MISELRLKVIASETTIGNIDREEAREMAKELLTLRQQLEQADGWVKWWGAGVQPVGDGVRVKVELRNGTFQAGMGETFDWSWRWVNEDIVAYRLL